MLIAEEIVLYDRLSPSTRALAEDDLNEVRVVIPGIHWPPGSDKFTINPTPKGNGVVPIKAAFALDLRSRGWQMEVPAFEEGSPGGFDGGRVRGDEWTTFVEWETGNISSSHRSMNRLTLALLRGIVVQGVLVLPDGAL